MSIRIAPRAPVSPLLPNLVEVPRSERGGSRFESEQGYGRLTGQACRHRLEADWSSQGLVEHDHSRPPRDRAGVGSPSGFEYRGVVTRRSFDAITIRQSPWKVNRTSAPAPARTRLGGSAAGDQDLRLPPVEEDARVGSRSGLLNRSDAMRQRFDASIFRHFAPP